MEAGKGVAEKKGTNDVVVQISGNDDPFFANQESRGSSKGKSYSFAKNIELASSPNRENFELPELENLWMRGQTSDNATSPSLEMTKPSTSPNMLPPRIPGTESVPRKRSFFRSEFSKPKSRLIEPPYPNDAILKEEKTRLVKSSSPHSRSSNVASPSHLKSTPGTLKENLKSAPITPKTPLMKSPGPEDEDEDDEVYKAAVLKVDEPRGRKWKKFFLIEFTIFLCIMGFLIASLTLDRLVHCMIWGLELWKWSVLVLVIFCGRLFAEGFINSLVFLIEMNYLLKKKVLYFVYGVKKSVQAFIWLGLVLLAWALLFDGGVKRSHNTSKILNYVTRTLASMLIGAGIWLAKTFLVKLLASSFHVNRFFDRIQESIFHQYVLRALSGPPVMEMAERVGSSTTMNGQLSFRTGNKKDEHRGEEVIDVDKLKKMEHGKVSAWTMRGLINMISGTRLYTLSGALDLSDDEEGEQKDKEITSEWEAKAAAYKIFRNVAKRGSKHIDEEDLLRFMKKEEVDNVMPLFQGAAETRKIKRSALKNWLVNVYNERKALAHSLNDTKTAIEELNRLLSVIVLVLIPIIWLLLMGFLTTQVLVFISSQLLLVVFVFGNTAKTIFEAIIFVFVMHPFDVGDRCVIDGVQMVVEEMNILTTVFLRFDNEKILYPNSVLATKPISNFYRSPEMSDSVEFAVDVSTTIETIGVLKSRIKAYLESKPQHWRANHSVQVKEIENVDKMKIALYCNHTINFQNIGDRGNRRSDLVLELKKIFEDLGIKYHLLPQEVRLSYVGGSGASLVSPPAR